MKGKRIYDIEGRKGALDWSWGMVMGALVFLVILALVLYFLFFSGGDWLRGIDWLLPGFVQVNKTITGIEVLRYDILTGEIKYYDGVAWIDFEKDSEVVLGKKKINYLDVKNDFANYYYKTRRDNNAVVLDMNLEEILDVLNYYNKNIVSGEDLEYLKRFNDLGILSMQPFRMYVSKEVIEKENIKSILYNGITFEFDDKRGFGDIEFNLVNYKGSGPGAGFFLSTNNKLELFYFNKEREKVSRPLSFSGRFLDSVFETMRNWKDSVFERPIAISIGFLEKDFVGPVEPLYVCPQFMDNKYIIVDLQKSVKADERCGGNK